jgi:Tfp pilus assembly protein PilX
MYARDPQRGSVLATSAVILAGLIGVAGLSVLSVQRSLGVSGQQRGHSQALHAAEAGVAAGATFLRKKLALGSNWGAYVQINCSPKEKDLGTCTGVTPSDLVGNGALPGDPNNPFDATANAWYEVTLFNNASDPNFATGGDGDAIIIMRSTGHGPDGARVVLEVEVGGTASKAADEMCVGYAQQGMSELNSGRNDCLGIIDEGDTATYTPTLP